MNQSRQTHDRRRIRGLLVLAVAAIVTTAGFQGATDTIWSAAAPSTSSATPSSTTTTATTPPPPTTVAAPTPTGSVGNPWPSIGPPPREHHAILTMGDSLMGGTYFNLARVLAAHGFDAVVYDAHVNASGLLDPMNGYSARDYLALQLAVHPDVDTVIFEWAGVCTYGCGTDALRYGSSQFFAAWQAAVRDLVRDARLRGLEVVWAISPPPAPDLSGEPLVEDWSNRAMRVLVTTLAATYVRNYYAAVPGVTTADWWRALSDTSGQWQENLWYGDAIHAVRTPDLVHLSEDGSTRTSTWTVAALAKLYER